MVLHELAFVVLDRIICLNGLTMLLNICCCVENLHYCMYIDVTTRLSKSSQARCISQAGAVDKPAGSVLPETSMTDSFCIELVLRFDCMGGVVVAESCICENPPSAETTTPLSSNRLLP